VRPLAGHAVPGHPCPAAPATPLLVVGAHDAAGQRSTSRFQALADCLAELPPRLVKPKWIMSVSFRVAFPGRQVNHRSSDPTRPIRDSARHATWWNVLPASGKLVGLS